MLGLYSAYCQTTADTAKTPYYLDMMEDPSTNFYQTQRAFNIYWQNRPIEKGSGYKPFKRWEYNTSEVIDDFGNIPAPGVLQQRIQQYKTQKSASSGSGIIMPGTGTADCLKSGNWIEIGPKTLPANNTSQPNGVGRLNAVAFHPTDTNKIYVGAPAGGLWISNDGGNTWKTTTDTLASLGVSSIAIDPINPDTIYIGTGDRDASDSYGRGVFRSNDGGTSWSPLSTGMGNTIVGKLIIDPSNHLTLLAATSSGIYRSTNGGINWSRSAAGNFKDLDICDSNSNYVYAASYVNASFYRSTDNGINFTKITSGLPTGERRMVISTTPADSNFVYALVTETRAFKGIYLSTDKGLTFTTMSTTPNVMDYSTNGSGTGGQAWYDLDITVDPIDKSIVYVGGVNIFQSLDSGKTWKINAHWVGSGGAPAIHADQHVLEIQPLTNAIFVGNDGGVYFTKDDGKKWTDLSDGIGNSQIYRLGQSAKVKNYVINGYQDNGTGMFRNDNWYTIMGGDGMECAIDPQNTSYSYSNLYYGDVRRFTNGNYSGKIAANGTNGITEKGGWVTPFVLREDLPSTMYIGYKNVWVSTNIQASSASTISWTKVSNNLAGNNSQNITYLENNPADPSILYLAKGGNAFLRSDNINSATPTWTNLKTSLPNNAGIRWIESDHKRSNTVWISQSNKIYESTNKGNTWTNISNGLPNLPILCIAQDSSSKKRGLYIGTYMGVFYKDTTMSSWIWFNDNMPTNARVRDIEIYHSPSGRGKSHIVCATYGRGNWWSPLYDEDENEPVAGFESNNLEICQNEIVKFKDTSDHTPTKWFWEITPNTITYLNGTDDCSQNPIVKFNNTGKYAIKLVVENCGGSDSTSFSDYIEVFEAVKSSSCAGVTNNENFGSIGIFNYTIHDFNQSSLGTKVEGGYLDYSCTKIANLKSDTTYLASVTGGSAYTQYTRIFIDFNNDGDLLDSDEMVFYAKGKNIQKDSIKVPINAVTNIILRMRVMSDYDTIPINPCDTLGYGQTEDYGLVVEKRIPEPLFTIDTNKICSGNDITLTDTSLGKTMDRNWLVKSYDTLSLSVSQDSIASFNLKDTGYYFAVLYLNDSIVNKRIDSIVYVKPAPDISLTVDSGSVNGCQGRSIKLSSTTNFANQINYSWTKDKNPINLENDSVLRIQNSVELDSGSYTSIGSLNGCVDTSNSVTIVVSPMPSVDFNIGADTQCLNSNQFEFNYLNSISRGTYTTILKYGDGLSSSSNNPIKTYSDTGSFKIWLIATSNYGCTDSSSKTVRVNSNPNSLFNVNKDTQCIDQNNFTLNSNSTSISVPLYHSWTLDDGTTNTNSSFQHSFNTAKNHSAQLVVANNLGCTDTSILNLMVLENPKASFTTPNSSACLENNAIVLTNTSKYLGNPLLSSIWNLDDGTILQDQAVVNHSYKSARTYNTELIAISGFGCSDTFNSSIIIYSEPVISVSIQDSVQCLNKNVLNFTNTTSGSISSHAWNFGDGNNSILATPLNHSYANNGSYIVTYMATNNAGCKADSSINIIINPSPAADFTGEVVCLGESINFTNNSSVISGMIAKNNWNFGDGNKIQSLNPSHNYLAANNYTVKLVVETDKGCKDSITKSDQVQVLPNPTANFNYNKISSWELETNFEFSDLSVDAINWQWLLNGSLISNLENPIITFSDTGTNNITLIVESVNGCTDTLVLALPIFPDTKLYIPSAFSPNKDNLNKTFKPLGLAVTKEYVLRIYNRWGAKVFETNNSLVGWDGTTNGTEALAGNYLFVIELIDWNGKKFVEKGTVSLLR